MDARIEHALTDFTPITLEALNDRAAMLERLDNKYIVPADRLVPALQAFASSFDVLEIGGVRAFTYATRYFDDSARRAYFDHHQGRRKRCKVRVRHYLDAGFSYLEVKLKDVRDVTIKKRMPVPFRTETLDRPALEFVEACYAGQYGEAYGSDLAPAVGMEYRRLTLVARAGGERMTIDTAMQFASPGGRLSVAPDMCIVETKSARGNGLADAVLRGLHLHPTPRCSKYCIATAALEQVGRRNGFLPALRRLSLLGAAVMAPEPAAVVQ